MWYIMNRLADALRELKELHHTITSLGNAEKRKQFSLQSDLDYIEELKLKKLALRKEIELLSRK